jgi:CRP-like cAMP-binding protein
MFHSHDGKADPKATRLGQVELFRHCTPKELGKLASVTDEVELAAGRVLCRQGEVAMACYVVVSGEADVMVGSEIVGRVGPGESVGEMGLIDARPRSAGVVARTDMQLYVIDARRFDDLLRSAPSVARSLLRELSARIRDLDQARALESVA